MCKLVLRFPPVLDKLWDFERTEPVGFPGANSYIINVTIANSLCRYAPSVAIEWQSASAAPGPFR